MAQRTFNGWRVRQHPGKGTFVAPNGKTVYCADSDVAEVFRYVAEQWHKRIEPLPKAAYNTYPNERKGYLVIHCSRPLGSGVGTGNKSNHVSHTAMDILGDKHHYEASCRTGACYGPQGRPHPWVKGFNTRQERELRAIRSELTRFAGGKQILRLGLDFAIGKRDGMHVEIAPGTTNADVKRAADALRKARNVGDGIEDLTEIHRMLTALGYSPNGAGVRAYQKDRGLTVDGVPGKNTRAALEADMATLAKIEDDIADLRDLVYRRTTVNLSQGTATNLATGQTTWSLSGFMNLVGNRVGRTDQRVHRMPATILNFQFPRHGGGTHSVASVLRGSNSAAKAASAAAQQGVTATVETLGVLNDVASGQVKIGDMTAQIKAALDKALHPITVSDEADPEGEPATIADDPVGDEDRNEQED